MKIVQVSQFCYLRGGAEHYFLNLSKALEQNGHTVAFFAMDHPNNIDTPWKKYFVSRVSFNDMNLPDKLKAPGRVIYSLEAKRKFTKLLDDFQPDIIHIHNIYHHLSPSILTVAKKRGIPVVMHVHDYQLICPKQSLFTKGAYCERCQAGKYYQCLANRCIKNSLAGSALASLEMYLHHSLWKIYDKNISIFIAPSQFMKKTLVRFNHDQNKIKVVYNSYSPQLLATTPDRVSNRGYLLYFGRLTEEKGVNTLIRAAAATNKQTIIAGEGPEEIRLKQLATNLKAPVTFLNFQNGKNLQKLIIEAQAIIIPSIWPENMPLSLLESLSLGKIVIGSRIGGLPEVINNKQNGLLFTAGDSESLAGAIKSLNDINQLVMSQAAKEKANNFSPEKNLQEILAIYRQLIKNPG